MPEDQTAAMKGAPETEDGANDDGELKAINVMVAALKPMREEQRRRALEYVLGRFGAVQVQPPLASLAPSARSTEAEREFSVQDIRTLREGKSPRSANEMAALVAYYVSELAPPPERKQEITRQDIERYFKNGGFKLTANAGQTLINAKNAGYLDGGSSAGQYKLNPVGYNLVVHRLGEGGGRQSLRRGRNGKKQSHRGKPSRT